MKQIPEAKVTDKIALLITAGGASVRFGRNKLLEVVCGKPVILHTITAFSNVKVSQIVITVSEELKKELLGMIESDSVLKNMKIKLVNGGKTRQESVFNGLQALDKDTEMVIIHDGARPLVSENVIEKCVKKALETRAAIVAVKAVDTIKEVNSDGLIISTPNRENLRCVQTPQVFDYNLILDAHKKLEGEAFSDDAGVLEKLGVPVYVTEGEYSNIKITTPSDVEVLENYLKNKA